MIPTITNTVPNICKIVKLSPKKRVARRIVEKGPRPAMMENWDEPIRMIAAEIRKEGRTVAKTAIIIPIMYTPAG